jgi:hypothetical protein
VFCCARKRLIPTLYIGCVFAVRVDPSIGSCIEPLLGSKYAVCQEILTKNRAFQAVLVKKP